MVKMILYPYRR